MRQRFISVLYIGLSILWLGSVNADPPATMPTEFSGIVTDFDGKPIAGATVEHVLLDFSAVYREGGTEVTETLTTGTDGRFTIAIRNQEKKMAFLRATADGYAWGWAYFSRTPNKIQQPAMRGASNAIVLASPHTLRGRLLDEDGKPARGIEVRLNGVRRICKTDEKGEFVFDKVGPVEQGSYREASEITVRTPGYVALTRPVRAQDLEPSSTLEMQLQRGVEICGTVWEAETHSPLQAIIRPQPDQPVAGDAAAISDDQGRYQIVVPPGEYRLHATRYPQEEGDDFYPTTESQNVVAVLGAPKTDVNFEFKRGRAIEGTVTAPSEVDVNRIFVLATMTNSGFSRWGMVAKDGTFKIGGCKPGRYEVTVVKSRNQGRIINELLLAPVTVTADADTAGITLALTEKNVPIHLQDVTAVVRHADGTLAEKARVVFIPDDTMLILGVPQVFTDATGKFVWPKLNVERAGLFLIRDAAGEQGLMISLANVLKNPGDELKLKQGLVFSGVITDENGKPLPGCRVVVMRQLGRGGYSLRGYDAVTDQEGRYRLTGIVLAEGAQYALFPSLLTRNAKYPEPPSSLPYQIDDSDPAKEHSGYDYQLVQQNDRWTFKQTKSQVESK